MLFADIIEVLPKSLNEKIMENFKIYDVAALIQAGANEEILLALCKLYIAIRDKEIDCKEHAFDYILLDKENERQSYTSDTMKDFEIIKFLFSTQIPLSELECIPTLPQRFCYGLRLFYILLSRCVVTKENNKELLQQMSERLQSLHEKGKIKNIISSSLKASKVMKSKSMETKNSIYNNCRYQIQTLFHEDTIKTIQTYRKCSVSIESTAPFSEDYEMEIEYTKILLWIYQDIMGDTVKDFAEFYKETKKLAEEVQSSEEAKRREEKVTYLFKCEEFVDKKIAVNYTALALADYMFPPQRGQDAKDKLRKAHNFMTELLILCHKMHGPLTHNSLTLVTCFSESVEKFCEFAKRTVFICDKTMYTTIQDIDDTIKQAIIDVKQLPFSQVMKISKIIG